MALGGFVVLQRLSTVLRHFVAEPSPTPTPTTPAPTGAGFGDGSGRPRFWGIKDRKHDEDIMRVLHRALEEHAAKEPRPALVEEPASAVYEAPTEEDIAEAMAILFRQPGIASLDALRQAAAREAALDLIRESEAENRRAFLFAADAAQKADDEEAMAVILAAL